MIRRIQLCTEAKAALKQMGWKPAIVHGAVREAAAVLGARATLDRLLIEALRRCPRPTGTAPALRYGREACTT